MLACVLTSSELDDRIPGVYDSIEDSWEVGQSRRMPQTSLFEKRHRQITEQDNDIDAPMYSQRHFEFLQHQHEHAFNKLRFVFAESPFIMYLIISLL